MHLVRIALATTRMAAMRHFYNQLFDAKLEAVNTPEGTFYQGEIGQLLFTLVPNDVAKIEARQNRHQMTFWVDDIEKTLHAAIQAGGVKMQQSLETNTGKLLAVLDPDGNTLEFIEHKTT
jgi:predicted enzyme related to lactoylglutathione lyase